MVYVGYLEDEERGRIPKDQDTNKAIEMARCDPITKRRIREVRETPGALWHIFDAVDADKIRDFLNKVRFSSPKLKVNLQYQKVFLLEYN